MSHSQLSPPLASRQFNGEVLLEEVASLRGQGVSQRALNDLASALSVRAQSTAREVSERLRHLASNRFADTPCLALLLNHWAAKLKTPADAAAVVDHFQRLVVLSAIISAVKQAAPSLRGSG